MVKLTYGSNYQIRFETYNDYYLALGFLANGNNCEIKWEHNENQGAWGSEGRIHCLVPSSYFPQFFKFTAGTGNIYARINCNEYVQALVMNHYFDYNTRQQNVKSIRSTVPVAYLDDFDRGYRGDF